jgi:2-polyprenyl-3-methyl-5-hydroxy-6-metoxy-1,4-benzoquinol methylase
VSDAAIESLSTTALFDDVADVFDDFSKTLDMAERPLAEWMRANLRPGARALDVGCGAGRHSVLLADLYESVLATDVSPNMIEIAERDRRHPGVTYEVCDALDMNPDRHGRFDLVYGFSCVFHMGPPATVLPQLAELVGPGGELVVFDPQRPPDYGAEGWERNYAFAMARMAFDMTSDIVTSVSVLRAFTHRSWIEISRRNVPMSRSEFEHEYTAALPGVQISDQEFPGFVTARWRRPGA